MSLQGKKLIYFGDSLTDVGVIFGALVDAFTAQILPGLLAALGPNPTPQEIALAEQQAVFLAIQQANAQAAALGFGPENAVTNEFTHANYTGDLTGAVIENFANAGARALGTQEPFGAGTGYDSNLGAQLDRFAASVSGVADPDSSAILYIGPNDFSDILGAAIEAPNSSVFSLIGAASGAIGALIDQLNASARVLNDLGIGTVFFGTLPAGTFFPSTDDLDDLSAGFSNLAVSVYNALLADAASSLRSEGIDVQVTDYAAVSNAIIDDPSGFGIVADRSDFLIDGSLFDSDQVGFWDPIHPAEAIHQAWGAYAAFVLEGGTTSSLSDFGTLNFKDNGDNAVFANGGNDTVFAFGGDDVVFGGSGRDDIFAGRGDDIVSGGASGDDLRGQAGNDIVAGGAGDDMIRGGSGDDVLIDGLGNDTVRGGSGDDVFIFVEGLLEADAAPTQDSFSGGSGSDTLYLVLGEASFAAVAADGIDATLAALGISTSSVETVRAIDGRDQVEGELGSNSWFLDADYWGLVPAPTVEFIA